LSIVDLILEFEYWILELIGIWSASWRMKFGIS